MLPDIHRRKFRDTPIEIFAARDYSRPCQFGEAHFDDASHKPRRMGHIASQLFGTGLELLSDFMESESNSRFLFCRIFLTRTGVHFDHKMLSIWIIFLKLSCHTHTPRGARFACRAIAHITRRSMYAGL